MEQAEFDKRKQQIESDYQSALKNLYIEYGLNQAKYKKGDIINSGDKNLLIDKITVYKSFGMPEPVYNGVWLKKDLTPNKKGERDSIYGNRQITLIKSAE